jgi:hypothetical protein
MAEAINTTIKRRNENAARMAPTIPNAAKPTPKKKMMLRIHPRND